MYNLDLFYFVVFLSGLLVIIYFTNYPLDFKSIKILFFILIFFQIIELIYFAIYSEIFQFFPTKYFGSKYNDHNFFRPIGIFYEANALSTIMLYFLFIFFHMNKRILVFIGCISAAISGSIFGIGLAITFLSMLFFQLKKKFNYILFSFCILISIYFINRDTYLVLFNRVINFSNDRSFKDRLGLGKWDFSLLPNSADPFISGSQIMGNTLGYLTALYGLIFLLPLLILIFFKLLKVNKLLVLSLPFFLISYQGQTYMYFYMFLATYLHYFDIYQFKKYEK